MATKKQHERFNKEVDKYIEFIGGEKINSECSGFKYALNTSLGILYISCHEPEKSQVFSIYMRFENYERALSFLGYEALGCNPKWNIHAYSDSLALGELKYRLNKISQSNKQIVA